jgi:hypothetical protein
VLQLPAGKTAQDVINDAKKKGAKAEDDWIHFADSGDPLPDQLRHHGHHGPRARDLRGDLLADRQGRRWHRPSARHHRHDQAVHRFLTR